MWVKIFAIIFYFLYEIIWDYKNYFLFSKCFKNIICKKIMSVKWMLKESLWIHVLFIRCVTKISSQTWVMLSQKPVHLHRVKFSGCWKTRATVAIEHVINLERPNAQENRVIVPRKRISYTEDARRWFLCIHIWERESGCCAGGAYLWNLLRCFRLCYKTLNHRRSTLSDCAGFQCNACVQKRPTEGVEADITMTLKGRDMGRARNAESR